MRTPGTLRGVHGQLKTEYMVAAELADYLVSRDPLSGTWTLTATVATSDPILLTQAPLVFVAPFKGGSWRWQIASFTISEGRLQAWLGAAL